MFRTFLTCVLLIAAIIALIAGALARAGTNSQVTAAAAGVPAEAAKSAPVTLARKSASVQGDVAEADKGNQAEKGDQTGKGNQAEKNDQAAKGDAQPTGAVKLSGESVVGNQNAPKSLVLVPWKSAQIGKMPGLSMLLDDSIRPVDKDVFMRELAYYRIRAGKK